MSECGPMIERCEHDEENPYSQISNALIEDNSLSMECRLLLIYLLKNKSNWKVYVSHLQKVFRGNAGRDKIQRMLKEAIEKGYMKREERFDREFSFGGKTYKNLSRTVYCVSEKPKFKKTFQRPENQALGFEGPEKPQLIKTNKNNPLSESYSLKKKQQQQTRAAPAEAPAANSASAEVVVAFLSKKEKEMGICTGELSHKRHESWMLGVDKLMRAKSIDPEKLTQVIEFALDSDFWRPRILVFSAFEKNFEVIRGQMGSVDVEKRKRFNKSLCDNIIDKLPEEFEGLAYDKKYAFHEGGGKEISLADENFMYKICEIFNYDYEQVCDALNRLGIQISLPVSFSRSDSKSRINEKASRMPCNDLMDLE